MSALSVSESGAGGEGVLPCASSGVSGEGGGDDVSPPAPRGVPGLPRRWRTKRPWALPVASTLAATARGRLQSRVKWLAPRQLKQHEERLQVATRWAVKRQLR